MNNRLVILDRDGVINEDSDDYIKSPEEWQPIPGSPEAIAQLSSAGFTVLVATNQSGIGRGYFDEYTLARMHEKMHASVEDAGGSIDGVFFCPHRPDENCDCRKPAAGLLDRMEDELAIEVAGAWYVGDSEKDLDCALARGCRAILVRTGKGSETDADLDAEKREKVQVFDNLQQASEFILRESGAGEL